MPELPEVETIVRQLRPLVEGRRIERIEIEDPRWSRPLTPAELEDALRGRRVEHLRRRGKYLLWDLEGDVHLAQHLRMTGAVLAGPDPEPPHARVNCSHSWGVTGLLHGSAGAKDFAGLQRSLDETYPIPYFPVRERSRPGHAPGRTQPQRR